MIFLSSFQTLSTHFKNDDGGKFFIRPVSLFLYGLVPLSLRYLPRKTIILLQKLNI